MPRMDGRHVLTLLKNDANLRRIPIVILSSSQNEADIEAAYELQANCYVTKPTDLDQFISIVQAIEEFWATSAELPCRPNRRPVSRRSQHEHIH